MKQFWGCISNRKGKRAWRIQYDTIQLERMKSKIEAPKRISVGLVIYERYSLG